MSQEIVKVTLTQDGESDLLTFYIKEKNSDDDYSLNLSDSSNSQTQLKRIFSRLLAMLIDNDISLKLEIQKEFTRALQKEVSIEYIKSLNDELIKTRATIVEDLASVAPDNEDDIDEQEIPGGL